MSAFKGYLLKKVVTDSSGNSVDVIFPTKYMEASSWKSTPNQREEIKAYRDENTRDLTRVTAAGRKSVFQFDTRASLHLADKIAIQKFFTDSETSADERKIYLTFWNEESNTYDSGYFYRPNMEFQISTISADDIIYEKLTFEFVEY